ncbi:SagB/ThcOx family dehydrogenase [Acinetobacter pittii]|uniref:SagB/ThcOx family dehydrogenase n=1 Tax=Acinetobacter pittii TaxID=48296 RepID=UPI00202A5202|nr:SagB/ThcOx family dehydrogenase [Acinetobacter pittii]
MSHFKFYSAHLSSRNLNYSDDPAYFNGLENESFEPIENSKIKEIDEKNASNYYYLNSDLDDISGEDILHGIIGRRSFQPFYKKEFNQNDIDSILWFSNQYARKRGTKIFESSDRDSVYDSAFSALHTYIVIYKDLLILDQVLSAGCYYYDLNKHALILIREGNYKKEVAKLAIGQKRAAGGLATIIIAADLEKYSTVYKHERSYRNLLINTAQLCQFYLVQATIKGFNTFITPAILDEEMADFLDLSDNIPLYIAAIG